MSARVKHRESTASGHPARAEGAATSAQVDLALRDYLERLSHAASDEDIGNALGGLGALFDMPNLELSCSSGAGPAKRRRAIYRSPQAPARVVKVLTRHPLYDWARDCGKTVSLSDAGAMLNAPVQTRELRRIEGLMVNLETAPGHTVHAGFYGTNGVANGLARSLLLVGTELACKRHAKGFEHKDTTAHATSREQQVLDLAMRGLTDAAVAQALGIAKRTVRFHLANARRKAGVTTRAQLIAHAARQSGGTGHK